MTPTRLATARAAAATAALAAAVALAPAGPVAADTADPYAICPEVYYYVVPEGSPGLDSIAGLILDDAERAAEIYELNAGRTQADGNALGEDRAVLAQWRLVVPFDAGGENVYRGSDPLCVVAVENALAVGEEPPSPPPPPPAYTPPPEDGASPTAQGEVVDLDPDGARPSIDPRLLAGGAVGLVLLTLLTLFWEPVLRGITWPFRAAARARAARAPKRRPTRPGVAARRRRAATEAVAADPDARRRAAAAHAELLASPADVPARPVALLTSDAGVSAVVPAGATPPMSSWRVVDTTTWRYGSGRSTAPVHFTTAAMTAVREPVRGVLVCLGLEEGGDALVHLDLTRTRGLLAVGGDAGVAADTVRVVGDGLHAAGVRVRVLRPDRPLHSLVADTIPVVSAPDPIQGTVPEPGAFEAVVVPRPLSAADEHVLLDLPPNLLVVAMGESRAARRQWWARDDGTVDTGALGLEVVVRHPERREP
ncbi:hypothetical protein SAMN05421803_11137 [Nocardiopsis flavescens]|uniref:Uncharacterized protein n=1 Tax=Nocardiopsis flavescens TaxID=758803 RepID=A0A1M6N2Z4_9ACTN|nr:hypothetical protein [Nocardiopsis flavescens]SHJ90077.1 hypothetical protein SAMN05421803_11137 [Nocardiopsis flavescens]